MIEKIAHVTDRTYESMLPGAEFLRWPGDEPPTVGMRVSIFDKDLNFTQHDVVKVEEFHVWVGPAIPWEDKDRLPPGEYSVDVVT